MAVLSDPDRFAVSGEFQADRTAGQFGAITKVDIRAAVNAVDDWAVANATSYNNALPAAAKAALTAPQKAMLLSYVLARRWLKGA